MIYKAVLFDMDGTLVDSVDDVAAAMNFVLIQNNYPAHPLLKYIELIGDGMENLVTMALPESKRNDTIIKKCLSEMKTAYSSMWMNKTHLYKGIAEALTKLNSIDIKLTVLSNKPDHFTKEIANKLLSDWDFDIVMGLVENSFRKPDPTSALSIASQLNIDPASFVYIGDSPTDMKTAINAGMFPVGVSWGYRSVSSLIDSGAKIIINSPEEIPSLF